MKKDEPLDILERLKEAGPRSEVQSGPYKYKILDGEVYFTVNFQHRTPIWYKKKELSEMYAML